MGGATELGNRLLADRWLCFGLSGAGIRTALNETGASSKVHRMDR
jgi:hypothetical protein